MDIPTERSTISEPHKQSNGVPWLNKVSQSPDFKATKPWNVQSARMVIWLLLNMLRWVYCHFLSSCILGGPRNRSKLRNRAGSGPQIGSGWMQTHSSLKEGASSGRSERWNTFRKPSEWAIKRKSALSPKSRKNLWFLSWRTIHKFHASKSVDRTFCLARKHRSTDIP